MIVGPFPSGERHFSGFVISGTISRLEISRVSDLVAGSRIFTSRVSRFFRDRTLDSFRTPYTSLGPRVVYQSLLLGPTRLYKIDYRKSPVLQEHAKLFELRIEKIRAVAYFFPNRQRFEPKSSISCRFISLLMCGKSIRFSETSSHKWKRDLPSLPNQRSQDSCIGVGFNPPQVIRLQKVFPGNTLPTSHVRHVGPLGEF